MHLIILELIIQPACRLNNVTSLFFFLYLSLTMSRNLTQHTITETTHSLNIHLQTSKHFILNRHNFLPGNYLLFVGYNKCQRVKNKKGRTALLQLMVVRFLTLSLSLLLSPSLSISHSILFVASQLL